MHKRYKILISLFLSLLIFLAFTPPLNPTAGGWTQQFMPDLNTQPISDIFFLDSLTGWATTGTGGSIDSAYILKTTNSGDNWNVLYYNRNSFTRIYFINPNTGFTTGVTPFIGGSSINKSTNGGLNWFMLSPPDPFFTLKDISILNADTMWVVCDDGTSGGVFRTINGGVNWTGQAMTNGNPDKIYMYDRNIGFASSPLSSVLYKTSNGGENWTRITGTDGFRDICFIDSQTGWKASGTMKKTTNGGLNWVQQTLPSGGIILNNAVNKISVINRDTLWGVGGSVFYGSGQFRGILYRTINGGANWLFQIPDTAINLDYYSHIKFTNKSTGWAYRSYEGGIHTTTGGDTSWLTGIQQVSAEIPLQFKLYQNYPNPFNPKTIISYELSVTGYVEMSVFDITGKKIIDLLSQKQNAGKYRVDFSGEGLSSGVYFYKIIINSGKEVFTDTKKMILLK